MRSIPVRARMIALGVLVAGPASADTSVHMGMDLGVVMGHGPLADRFDPFRTVGMDATLMHDRWAVEAGFVFLDGERREPVAALGGVSVAPADLYGAGFNAGVRRRFDRTGIGYGFVGAGFSILSLHHWTTQIGMDRAGVAYGPKLMAGIDSLLETPGQRGGVSLAATYQWMVASMSDGTKTSGAYAGLEMTILWGYGTCRRDSCN